jgi:hypothetical protein
MSNKNLEKRKNIKYCVKIGRSASETVDLLTLAYIEYAVKKSSVLNGEKMWKMIQKVGRQKTQRTDVNMDRVRTLVRSDRKLGVRLIAEEG